MNLVPVVPEHDPAQPATEHDRVAGDRVEHRLRVGGRRADDSQDLRGGRLLLTRLGASSARRAAFSAASWAGVGFRVVLTGFRVGFRGVIRCLASSFSKQLLQSSKDRRHRLRGQPAEGAEKPPGVDRSELVQSDEARSALKPEETRHGYARPLVVIGATITVRRYWFNSSGDITRQGRVF